MQSSSDTHSDDTHNRRKRVIEALSKARIDELAPVWEQVDPKPRVQLLRGPEVGMVMVRGRIGGGGDPFNFGEVTVARATVQIDAGVIGHGQALGTDKEKVRLAAIFDALWQMPVHHDTVEALADAVAARCKAEDGRRAAETAATRVDFFTMVRGDD